MEVNSINEFLHVTPIPKRRIALPSKTSRGPSKVIYSFFNTRFLLMFFLDVPTCSLAVFCRVCDWALIRGPPLNAIFFFGILFLIYKLRKPLHTKKKNVYFFIIIFFFL